MVANAIDAGRAPADFDVATPADRNAMAIMVGVIWFMVLAGFIPDMLQRLAEGAHYQTVTHAHAFLAVTWLVLLTVQATLARQNRRADHMRLGRIGRWAGLGMVVASIVTAIVADMSRLASAGFKPERLAFQISHILVFGALVAWAFASTNRPGAHKRLILLGTIALLDAATSRWIGSQVQDLLGEDFFGQWALRFPIPLAMIAAIGFYDVAMRRRLHPVFVPAAGLIAGSQILATWLFFQPAFGAACAAFLRMF